MTKRGEDESSLTVATVYSIITPPRLARDPISPKRTSPQTPPRKSCTLCTV